LENPPVGESTGNAGNTANNTGKSTGNAGNTANNAGKSTTRKIYRETGKCNTTKQ
jgi:hypothetical protein